MMCPSKIHIPVFKDLLYACIGMSMMCNCIAFVHMFHIQVEHLYICYIFKVKHALQWDSQEIPFWCKLTKSRSSYAEMLSIEDKTLFSAFNFAEKYRFFVDSSLCRYFSFISLLHCYFTFILPLHRYISMLWWSFAYTQHYIDNAWNTIHNSLPEQC